MKNKRIQQLLQTSFELFTEKGFTKTTISDIVNRAGLAKGTFYLYFKDKYDLRDRLVTYKTSQLFGNAHTALIEQNIQVLKTRCFSSLIHIIDRLERNRSFFNSSLRIFPGESLKCFWEDCPRKFPTVLWLLSGYADTESYLLRESGINAFYNLRAGRFYLL